MKVILFNPLSGDGSSKLLAENFSKKLSNTNLVDMTSVKDLGQFVSELSSDDEIYYLHPLFEKK